MKPYLLGIAVVLVSSQVRAQAITAGELQNLCVSKNDSDRAACLLIVQAYMHGFIEGVGKGVVDTYKYDPQVLAMVRDVPMKDMAPRLKRVAETATCIQRVSASQMTTAFTQFMLANSSMKQDSYSKAMTRAIVSKYCQKYFPPR